MCSSPYNLLPTTGVRQLKGFITGFHIYTSTFSVTCFPLSKKVDVEHPIIGQQQNGANNLFNINCHTRIRNGSRLFFILPSNKGQLNNTTTNNNNVNININNDNNRTNGMIGQ